jgi:hypothetical protein
VKPLQNETVACKSIVLLYLEERRVERRVIHSDLRDNHVRIKLIIIIIIPWPQCASELFRPSDRLLSAKLVSTFVDGGFNVVSVTDRYARILGFLNRSRYFFFQVAPQLWPPLFSSGKSSWLHIRRPGFDSRHYQKKI